MCGFLLTVWLLDIVVINLAIIQKPYPLPTALSVAFGVIYG